MRPTLKAPGTKRLKPSYDDVLSNFAFKSNLRRYSMAGGAGAVAVDAARNVAKREAEEIAAADMARMQTRLDSAEAGRSLRTSTRPTFLGRFWYVARVKCPYRVAGKASALRAGMRASG